MSQETATVTLDGDAMQFGARSGSGHSLVLDDGEGNAGFRPAELVPIAAAACTAMDVISILRKKRQVVTGYEVRAVAEQREGATPAVFTRIEIEHVVDGPDLDVEAVPALLHRAVRDPLLRGGRHAVNGRHPDPQQLSRPFRWR